jgi:anthraniloyl-CoA monooxygenase
MKINIVGGGPAGLYFGILMKKLDPDHEISIFERDGPNDTYGWGIVFSDKTLFYLGEADPETHVDITKAFETWDNVDVCHRGRKVTVRGNRFSGIARLAFLNILQKRCRELDVRIHFRNNITNLDHLADCDLLVGADGARSLVRETYAETFQPSIDARKNTYLWLGTHQLFNGLTLIFEQNPAGLFVAHAYRFNQTTSTFIVECVGNTWENAGFETMSEQQTCNTLEQVFENALDGRELLHNDFVRWLNFIIVKNRNWYHDNVVLLGDALHTAHFSIGSGTKLAVEDAIALARSFRENHKVGEALSHFQETRKPVVDDLQAAAHSSLVWLEEAEKHAHLEPIPLAYELMTRSTKIDRGKLKERDPEFIAEYDRWRSGG